VQFLNDLSHKITFVSADDEGISLSATVCRSADIQHHLGE